MKVYWETKVLKKVQKLAKSDIRIKKRLISIEAASCFNDLRKSACGNAHFLKGNRNNKFALDLCSRGNTRRLICSPCDDCKKDNNGNYVEEAISEIHIEDLENDYH